uniref:ATP synthase complex subunit 8 n=1 Tax=Piophila megastigmata TaxID=1603418 RepID=A0A8K1W8R7_9MUSC|nr:ATP synthase F0 subunit 8 [Piophila casei]UFY98538.1 ATP synthase F0 subunit 8 [Piophila megastigmata]UFY98551.1 ATP synthase F0 subunit 8 [Piophila megastigmata]UTN43257.1 ATP synthase F0 subunit 8 [Piophila casei]
MPQMAPIGWLSLFIIFSVTFLLFSVMNYYSVIPLAPKSSSLTEKTTNSMNWKW